MDSNERTIGGVGTLDGSSIDSMIAFYDTLAANHLLVGRECKRRYNGGLPVSATLIKERDEYAGRPESLWSRAVNKLYNLMDYFL
ncbi:hypothetical protein KY360_05255 [Candidatus Woesearchaeota archaeon]|nr:hypothetical protein [Candidatus Woesearchaeota archaeon]